VLKALSAGGAVCEPFGVFFAPFLFVEKHPFVVPSNPPELPQIGRCCSHEQYNAATETSPYPLISEQLLSLLQIIACYCY
jgi:hypothetical protein